MRRRRTWLFVATGVLVAAVGALGLLALCTVNVAGDRCVNDSRAPASSVHSDVGPLPWQWTCRYDDGTEIKRSFFDDRSA